MLDLTLDKLLLFFFCAAPGVVAMQVYSLLCPRPERNWQNSILEVLTYSTINLIPWSWWVFSIVTRAIKEVSYWELTAALFIVCVLWPTLTAAFWYWLRVGYLHEKWHLDNPIPNGWDYFIKKRKPFFILFHKKDGGMFGGLHCGDSYSSSYPHEPNVYIEKVFEVDQETGAFLREIPGSLGCVVRLCDYERLEFHEVKSPNEQKAITFVLPSGRGLCGHADAETDERQRAAFHGNGAVDAATGRDIDAEVNGKRKKSKKGKRR